MANVRGTVLLRVVKLLRSQRERALERVAPPLQRYLRERINVGGWYPTADYFALLRSAVELSDGDAVEAYDHMGSFAARVDMHGVYRSLLRSGDVARTVRSLATLWRDQYDAGSLETIFDVPGAGVVRLRDHELGVDRLCAMLGAYIREAALLAGGREVRVHHPKCVMARMGLCEWRVAWKADDAVVAKTG